MRLSLCSNAIFIVWCLLAFVHSSNVFVDAKSAPFNRTSFPPNFLFGAGSSAYQSEGAAKIDGKGLSIWDTYTLNHPERIGNRSNGDVAVDFYHRYKEDIHLINKIGLNSFRFSISWPRVLPFGKVSYGVNPIGVKFYNDLIDELISKGIKPLVTIFHWDLPQALMDEYGGFLSDKIANDFEDYAEFCFKTFGDRVKDWITINEPLILSQGGYGIGAFAPGRCSSYVANCTGGNSATEPYIVSHNILLAHAKAVKVYREKFQVYQKGQIGITLVTYWFEPMSNNDADMKAASRALDFQFGWFAHPLTYGDYPEIMRKMVGERLPKFTESESKLVKGSMDFIGLNYYTSLYAQNDETGHSMRKMDFINGNNYDAQATYSITKNGIPIGEPTALSWLTIYPLGLERLLVYIKDKYNNPAIIITENGCGDFFNDSTPITEARRDVVRIKYHSVHLQHLAKAIKEGVNVKGYFTWSFTDYFEWFGGYRIRFGLIYIDYKNGLNRYLKRSAYWLKRFLLK